LAIIATISGRACADSSTRSTEGVRARGTVQARTWSAEKSGFAETSTVFARTLATAGSIVAQTTVQAFFRSTSGRSRVILTEVACKAATTKTFSKRANTTIHAWVRKASGIFAVFASIFGRAATGPVRLRRDRSHASSTVLASLVRVEIIAMPKIACKLAPRAEKLRSHVLGACASIGRFSGCTGIRTNAAVDARTAQARVHIFTERAGVAKCAFTFKVVRDSIERYIRGFGHASTTIPAWIVAACTDGLVALRSFVRGLADAGRG